MGSPKQNRILTCVEAEGSAHQGVVFAIEGGPDAYAIRLADESKNVFTLPFQQGDPAKEVNGITNEQLLAIVKDRLSLFQQGDFPCRRNEEAILCIQAAIEHLHARTLERMDRGVEGQSQP